jgi:hypothetical protein
MRFAGWALLVVAAVAAPLVASTGCKSSCTQGYDHTETVVFTELSPDDASTPPTIFCSTCGGPVQSTYFECQSTCAPQLENASTEAGIDAGDDSGANVVSASCIVDSCASTVLGEEASCQAVCADLFPGKNVTSCTSTVEAGAGVTCTIHEDEVCS